MGAVHSTHGPSLGGNAVLDGRDVVARDKRHVVGSVDQAEMIRDLVDGPGAESTRRAERTVARYELGVVPRAVPEAARGYGAEVNSKSRPMRTHSRVRASTEKKWGVRYERAASGRAFAAQPGWRNGERPKRETAVPAATTRSGARSESFLAA